MSVLMEKKIKVNNILTINSVYANAIDDDARAKILQVLYKKQLSAEQIANHLKKSGHKKALTTVRHHIEILKNSGLIEIVKIKESRGGITKYYGTSTKFLPFLLPTDFAKKHSTLIKLTASKIEKVLNSISKKTCKFKKSKQAGYNEYVLIEIFNHAMTSLLEKN